MEYSDELVEYEIRVRGRLTSDYAARRFGDMSILVTSHAEKILRVTVIDQAALHGLLSAI